MQPLSVSTRSRVAGRLHVPLAAAALALVALSCGAPPAIVGPSATPTATAATGVSQVVFAASLADNQELYLADPATGLLTRLTHDPAPDAVPVWSPDGLHVAFIRFAEDGSSRIHVMNADGTGDRVLTDRAGAMEISPTWSPDGRQIAFASVTGNGGAASDSEIYAIGAQGGGLRQLTHDPRGKPNDPVWSPDGSLIAFDAGDPTPALYVIDPAGGDARRLSPPDARLRIDWPLLWAFDGSALAFAGNGPTGQRDVYLVNWDGSGLVDLAPTWSPDGRRLAFWSDRDGPGDIYLIGREGGAPRRLTTGSRLSETVTLAWSPDGRHLIAWSSPGGQAADKNYVVDAASGDIHRLTNEPGDEYMALWRPRG
ncbi:MAG: hypothetical protein E6I94_11255 [Chloroflexi bacterium]|nr:MAG: hypothetical protein E6I94_11255 [Chloroflexota bacterium]